MDGALGFQKLVDEFRAGKEQSSDWPEHGFNPILEMSHKYFVLPVLMLTQHISGSSFCDSDQPRGLQSHVEQCRVLLPLQSPKCVRAKG